MIQAINAVKTNTTNSNKIPFGFHERGPACVVSVLYSRSMELHELRKKQLFYKIFPFLNRVPEKEVIRQGNYISTVLSGENSIPMRDLYAQTDALSEKCLRLKNKQK